EILDQGMQLYADVTPATCFGYSDGSIKVGVEHGVLQYTVSLVNISFFGLPIVVGGGTHSVSGARHDYTWNNLPAGVYTFTVTDAAGCTKTTTRTITQLQKVTAGLTVTNGNCPGDLGQCTIIPAGGNGSPYSYSLNGAGFADLGNGITLIDLAPGAYTLVVKCSLGCSSDLMNFTITTPPVWNVTAVSTEETCNGDNDGTITVTATGANGAPYTYSIDGGAYVANNVFGGLAAGNHNIKVKDSNGCVSNTLVVNVVGYGALGMVVNKSNPSCWYNCDGEVDISGVSGKPPYLYSFDGGDDGALVGGAYLISSICPGSRYTGVTDSNGCVYDLYTSFSVAPPVDIEVLEVLESTSGTNGAIDIEVSGGIPGYAYEWLQGEEEVGTTQDIEDLLPLEYFVTVTDTVGCIDTLTVPVPGTPSGTDADEDGLTDYEENHIYFTDPSNSDTDGDLVPDGE
ncbi:MAG: SprB repeat-containing protein, partial [Flavobacteriales bacterium]